MINVKNTCQYNKVPMPDGWINFSNPGRIDKKHYISSSYLYLLIFPYKYKVYAENKAYHKSWHAILFEFYLIDADILSGQCSDKINSWRAHIIKTIAIQVLDITDPLDIQNLMYYTSKIIWAYKKL